MNIQTPSSIPPSPNPESVSSPRTGERVRFFVILLGVGTVMAGLLVVGILPRLQRNAEINAAAKETKYGLLKVNTVTPHRADAKTEITIPGNIQAVTETTIYSRMDGYLSKRYVDIGDRVQAGQLLAEIDSPETDRQLDQGRASLVQARAAYAQALATVEQSKASELQAEKTANFNRVSAIRWQALQQEGAVARQDFDEKKATYDASAASVKAAQATINANQSNVESTIANIRASEANVRRLQATQSYKTITAPFSGIITARNVDTGALITSGSGGTNSVWLYKVAQSDILRIFVDLPQTYVSSIHPGQQAKIIVRELPKRTFIGTVTRTANALDTASHTLRTEVQVNNSDLTLLPGMYAQVKFVLNRANPSLMVPANAIIVRSDGPQVAIVGADQKVHYQKVAIGRDYGTEVELTNGLQGGEHLVINPTDEVVEGVKVKAVAAQPKPKA